MRHHRTDPAIEAVLAETAILRTRLARLEAAIDLGPLARTGQPLSLPLSCDGSTQTEMARLNAELAMRDHRLTELEAVAEQRIAALSETLAALEQSVSWRVTAPIRAIATLVPESVQRAAFRLIRAIYWMLTPHRMAARFRWMVDGPILQRSVRRIASLSEETRTRLGAPLRRAYGPSPVEQLDIFLTNSVCAPLFVFVHGGAWREGQAKDYAFPAEMFIRAGAHYVVLDFMEKMEAGGDIRGMVEQVRRAIAWIHANAASFGGNPDELYVGGHSSGAHLAGLALVTKWQEDFGLPPDIVKGGLLMSGMYDMTQIRRSMDYAFLRGSEDSDEKLSPNRHLSQLTTPLIVTFGSEDGPEFQTHSRDLVAASLAAGKAAQLIVAANFGHMEMLESLASPYGPNGRAALEMMKLPPVNPSHRLVGQYSDEGAGTDVAHHCAARQQV